MAGTSKAGAADHRMAAGTSIADQDVIWVDDLYSSNEEGEGEGEGEGEVEEEIFPLSDEKYAEALQCQEVLMSSLVSPNLLKSSSSSNMEVLMNQFQRTNIEIKIQKGGGESSQSFCEICMEGKPADEMFRNMTTTCRHSYCLECIGKHVASKVQENAYLVKCPDPNCRAQLEPDHCRSIVPEEILDRWSTTLCDSLILGSSRFYCPFKDCSGVMEVDNEGETGEVVRESECPYCRRLFCAQCKVPWHSEISCDDFQRLDKNDTTREDLMAVELANKLEWKRCPQCGFFVERREGCLHITCRCGFQFCYRCGSTWTRTHGDCRRQ